MSTATLPQNLTMAQRVRDVVMLTKPKIIVLLAITCLAGALVAAKGNGDLLQLHTVLLAVLGLCLSSGGANAVNMWYDRDIDAVMDRTAKRPVPSGRMQATTALLWGVGLGVAGVGLLALWVNLWAAAMAAAGYLFYVFVYTMGLKRRTVQNIVIGGAAGSFPPLVGWAAVQGDVSAWLPWGMFAVIFLWTPPHFWALALMVNADYTRAGVPMLPVVAGVEVTKVQIVQYTVVLLVATVAMGLLPPLSWGYTLAALVLGLWWLKSAVDLLFNAGTKGAQRVFVRSLYYLAYVFTAMVVFSFV